MYKLFVFDADGVLLDSNLGGFKDLLIQLGKASEVKKIDDEYQKRKNLGPWGLEELANLFSGIAIKEVVRLTQIYCQEKLMLGAVEVVEELKKKGIKVGVLSSGPQFLLDELKRILLLDFAMGNVLEEKKQLFTGKIIKKIDRYIKAEVLKQKMEELKISQQEAVVVGDSLTDLPMAQVAGKFIAFNSQDEKVKETADSIITKKDLKEILYALD